MKNIVSLSAELAQSVVKVKELNGSWLDNRQRVITEALPETSAQVS